MSSWIIILTVNGTENATFGIDLSKDWTNASLKLVRTERPRISATVSSPALWFDNGANWIYRFGGTYVTRVDPPSESIWRFEPNGDGSGNWTEIIGLVAKPFPPGILGTRDGIFTSDNSDAYFISGHIGPTTSPMASVEFYNTGLLRFNFKTLTLTNSSELGSPILGGALLNVPIYGPNGILIKLGGLDNDQRVGFNNISVFDKNGQKWYSQIAEGDIPQPRTLFCAVGVQGKAHATFEM